MYCSNNAMSSYLYTILLSMGGSIGSHEIDLFYRAIYWSQEICLFYYWNAWNLLIYYLFYKWIFISHELYFRLVRDTKKIYMTLELLPSYFFCIICLLMNFIEKLFNSIVIKNAEYLKYWIFTLINNIMNKYKCLLIYFYQNNKFL